MADHYVPPLTPAQHRAYHLTCVHQAAISLGVTLEMARQDRVSSVALADRLGIDVGTLATLERALQQDGSDS